MPEVALKLRPTVNAEFTPSLNEAGISSCNLIRFRAGLPEKRGGWSLYYPSAVSGIPYALWAWQDLNTNDFLAVGATESLSVISDGVLQDITPQFLISDFAPNFTTVINTPTVTVTDSNISNVTTFDSIFFNTPVSVGGLILQGAYAIASVTGTHSYTITAAANATSSVSNAGAVPAFATTSGSAVVTVTLTAHGYSVGNAFTFPISTTVGGATITGTYKIATVPTVDTFTINVDTAATSTTTGSMNGGEAELIYYFWLGPQAAGLGYGVGTYGTGAYGLGNVPSSQTGDPITATNWTLDNWGEILLACPTGGGIYQWQPSTGFTNAGFIPTAPTFNRGIFVAMPAQILVAFGSTAGAPGLLGPSSDAEQQDPLIVRWSDQLDYTTWIPTSTNQAGSYHIPTGSRIVGGLQAPQQALLWTDTALWAMSYMGPPLVFGFNQVGAGCGMIGLHAAGILRGNVFWMGLDNFFVYTGSGVSVVPCSVWDIVFQDLDTDNQDKCACAVNSSFNEVEWYFPSLSGGSGECDKYVKFNMVEQSWDYGSLDRSAWIDQSVLGQPIGASPTGLIYQHEVSNDAGSLAMQPTFTTGWFTIAEGQDLAFVDWFFPDMKWMQTSGTVSASVQVTIETANYPNQPTKTFGPFSMDSAKEFVNCRLRGRLVRFTFASSDFGTWWRLGNVRIRMAPSGRR